MVQERNWYTTLHKSYISLHSLRMPAGGCVTTVRHRAQECVESTHYSTYLRTAYGPYTAVCPSPTALVPNSGACLSSLLRLDSCYMTEQKSEAAL